MHRGFSRLTPRETVILEHLMRGRTATEIAKLHVVTVSTVRSQVKEILRKLEVSSTLAAVVLAYRSGWHVEEMKLDD